MLASLSTQKLKRLRCSACPYRSNFRSDVGRHIRHKHRDVPTVPITVMSAVEAAATLSDYMDMWTHRKVVTSSSGSHVAPGADERPETGAETSQQANQVSYFDAGIFHIAAIIAVWINTNDTKVTNYSTLYNNNHTMVTCNKKTRNVQLHQLIGCLRSFHQMAPIPVCDRSI